MTASAVNNAKYTNFTLNLLLDTGWYDEVDFRFVDDIIWGKGKGCNFFQLGCKDLTTNYSEFSKNSSEEKCTFDHNGIGPY